LDHRLQAKSLSENTNTDVDLFTDFTLSPVTNKPRQSTDNQSKKYTTITYLQKPFKLPSTTQCWSKTV